MSEPQRARAQETGGQSATETAKALTLAADPAEPFLAAFRAYVRTLQQAWSPVEASSRVAEVQREYVRSWQESAQSGGDVQRRLEQATRDYQRALQEAWLPPEVAVRAQQAYRAYLGAVQQAWGQADLAALDPASLTLISQTLLLAASYAVAAPSATDTTKS